MAYSPEETKQKLRNLKLGEHLCCIYRNIEEQLSIVIPFMIIGLENREKCIYILDENTKELVAEAFVNLNFDLKKYMHTKQFEFFTKENAYLKNGYFDPDKMIGLLKQAQQDALEQGYSGLRVTGEMTWVFTKLPGVERLVEYEAKLNYFCPASKSIAICQYNENKFEPGLLLNIIHTHPKIVLYDTICSNPYYMPPDEFLTRLKSKTGFSMYEDVKGSLLAWTRLEAERDKIEEILWQERDKFLGYLNIAGFIIVNIDAEEKVSFINKKGCEILGYRPEEIIGKNWFDNFVPEIIREKVRAVFLKLISGEVGPIEYFENPVLTSSGEERLIAWHNAVLRDKEGRVTSTLSSGEDTTEHRRMEEELNKKVEILERFQKAAVGREMRIIELKARVMELEAQLPQRNPPGG